MKNSFFISLTLLGFTINATACSDSDNSQEEKVVPGDGNILIAYFSYPEPDGMDASSGASRLIKEDTLLGNTEYIAQVIQKETGGDIFVIETVQQYPASHDPLVDQASDEKETDARPTLARHIENIEQYDIIFIGYPTWWADLPMPLYTFLEEYDFSGKTIVPFNTHGGSGLSNTVATIRNLQPDATVTSGFTVSRNAIGNAENVVIDWLNDIGID